MYSACLDALLNIAYVCVSNKQHLDFVLSILASQNLKSRHDNIHSSSQELHTKWLLSTAYYYVSVGRAKGAALYSLPYRAKLLARTLSLRALLRLKYRISKFLEILHLRWIPAHTDCWQNDVADELANMGSSTSTNNLISVNTPQLDNPRFDYTVYTGYLRTHHTN